MTSLRVFIIWLIVIFTLPYCQYRVQSKERNTTYEIYVESIPIVSLGNDTLVSGNTTKSIFVQMGNYRETMYYQLMIKNETDGKMKYIKLKADDTYIYEYEEGSDSVPHIEVEFEIKKVYGEVVEPSTVNTDFIGFSDIIAPTRNISIHVPKGTVDRSMSINLKGE